MIYTYAQLKQIVGQYVKENEMAVPDFKATANNLVGLLDKVGKTLTLDSSFIDKLTDLDGDFLPLGKTVEEWHQDLILPEDYDENAKTGEYHKPSYRPVCYSYTLGRKKFPISIKNDDVERACNNEATFSSITTTQTKRQQDSIALYRYNVKKEILAKFIKKCNTAMNGSAYVPSTPYEVGTYLSESGGTGRGVVFRKMTASVASSWSDAISKGFIVPLDLECVIAKPIDTATGEAFTKQVMNDVESAQFAHEGHSLNGNTLQIEDGLKLYIRKGIMSTMNVDVMAGAFNRQNVAVPAQIKVLDDLGTADASVYAILVDTRGTKLHPTYDATRDNLNEEADFLNIVRHMEHTAFISNNTFIKVYKSA